MPKRRLILACCSALAIAVTVTLLLWPHEPSYQGRPLSYWVRLLSIRSRFQPGRDEAETALRLAGTNAVPFLVKWVKGEEGPISRAVGTFLWNVNKPWYYSYASDSRTAGAAEALRLLGPEAKGAIPELTRLMNDWSHDSLAQRAATILPYLGPEALPSLAATLTNKYPIRCIVLERIPLMGTEASPLVPQLVQLLSDTNTFLATGVAVTLGKLRLEPTLVMPSLTNCLQSPKPFLRMAAAEALLNFANPPDAARTTLLTLVSDSDPVVRIAATNAVRRTGISVSSPR